MTRVVCIGECMVELSAECDGRYHRAFAGDAYNTAVYLKRSAPGLEVQFATVTGDDALSAAMRAAWDGEGIDAALASARPGAAPGLYMIDTDSAGERRFTYWRGQSPARRWLAALEATAHDLAGADLVYLSGISLAILPPGERPRAIDFLRALGVRVAFDPNVRPALWESAEVMEEIITAAIGAAAIVLPSLDDAEQLWSSRDAEAQVARLLALGAAEIALTLGPEGCIVADVNGPAQTIAAPTASAIDTSGAGDAFNGAYLAARLSGAPSVQAARAGLALAAGVVGHRGALTPPSGARP